MTQLQYIAALFAALAFAPAERRAWLHANYGRAFADELSGRERHEVIERLKQLKAAPREAAARDAASGWLAFE